MISKKSHLNVVKNNLKYINFTLDLGLYNKKGIHLQFHGYVDKVI